MTNWVQKQSRTPCSSNICSNKLIEETLIFHLISRELKHVKMLGVYCCFLITSIPMNSNKFVQSPTTVIATCRALT